MNRNTNKLKRIYSRNSDIESPAKRQFRNENEKRRRDLSTQLTTNLRDILLVTKPSDTNEENTKLDKGSVLRQTVTFLQKHQQNITLNMFDTNSDLTVFDDPIANTTDRYCPEIDSRDDMSIDSLSSLSSSPETEPFSDISTTNNPIQDTEYLTSTTNPTND
ncbi:unnamed protein product [Adineta steineri]|uniref:BHLH domain-containing protein n=1 Tax=Adineta steineri TaxID=433720 RepID=A0A813WME6_9BILA|nr:unnamed protein product [Adineta steineri]